MSVPESSVHLAGEAHLVEGQLVLPGRALVGGTCGEVRHGVHYLHDGRQEGLRVEEARQPDGDGQVEVSCPALQLADPQEEVGVPNYVEL